MARVWRSGIQEPWERPQLAALGERLREGRAAAGLTRAQLAASMGIHRGTLRRIECGLIRTRPGRILVWLVLI